MHICIYTKNEFYQSDKEHILQNFLGARWCSNKISCNEVQSIFGRTIDCALEERLKVIRTLFGTKGGRGGESQNLKNIKDKKGNKYHIKPGGVPCIPEPIIQKRPIKDSAHLVQVSLGHKKQLEWAVDKLRKQFPNVVFDINEIRKKLRKCDTKYLKEKIHLELSIGGTEYFRGLLKSAFNLLGVNSSETALMPCFDSLRCFILTGSGDSKKYIRHLPSSDELQILRLGQIDHFIGIFSNGKTVEGIVQFFGGIGHLVRLTDVYDGADFCYGYIVNPLRDSEPSEIRNPTFYKGCIPTFYKGIKEPSQDVKHIYKEIISCLLKKYYDFAQQEEVSRIVNEELMQHKGKLLTEDMLERLISKTMRFIESRLNSGWRIIDVFSRPYAREEHGQ
jgi:hypothetical protein